MNQLIEYRIKTEGDKGKDWQEIPLIKPQITFAQDKVERYIKTMAQATNAVEIRWNWVGSLQGHCVRGPLCHYEPVCVNQQQLELMQHTVEGGGRNFYGAMHDSPEEYEFDKLVKSGLAIKIAAPNWMIDDVIFQLTDDGKEFLAEATP